MPLEESKFRWQGRIASLVGRPAFWLLLIGLIFCWPIARALRGTLPPALPDLGAVPLFASVDQQGRTLGTEQLRGRVWIADFIDTRCAASALSSDRMRQLQHRARNLGDALHLVTFMIGPGTPETRLAWARAHAANPRLWSFLASDPAIESSLAGGSVGCQSEQLLYLADRRLRLRGSYDPALGGSLERLLREAGLLVNRGD